MFGIARYETIRPGTQGKFQKDNVCWIRKSLLSTRYRLWYMDLSNPFESIQNRNNISPGKMKPRTTQYFFVFIEDTIVKGNTEFPIQHKPQYDGCWAEITEHAREDNVGIKDDLLHVGDPSVPCERPQFRH